MKFKGFLRNLTALVGVQKYIPSEAGMILARGASAAFLIQVIGTGIRYINQVILARVMGGDAYGIYTYAISLATILGVAAAIGMPTATLRFIPEYIALHSWSLLLGIIRASRWLVFLTGVIIALLGNLIILIFQPSLQIEQPTALIISFWLIPLFAITSLENEILKAIKQITAAYAPQFIFRPLLLSTGVILLYSTGVKLTGLIVLFIVLITLPIVIFLQRKVFSREIRAKTFRLKPEYDLKRWLQVSFPLLLISGFLILLDQADIIMIGGMLDNTAVGTYNAALRSASLVKFILVAVNAVAAPLYASLYAQKATKRLEKIVALAAHWIFWPSLAISIFLLIFGKWILGFFGTEFVASYGVMVILIIGQLINASAGAVTLLLNMTGFQNKSAPVFGWSALVNIALNLVLIPALGTIGAALGTSLTMLIWNFWLHHLVSKHLGLYPSIYSTIRRQIKTNRSNHANA